MRECAAEAAQVKEVSGVPHLLQKLWLSYSSQQPTFFTSRHKAQLPGLSHTSRTGCFQLSTPLALEVNEGSVTSSCIGFVEEALQKPTLLAGRAQSASLSKERGGGGLIKPCDDPAGTGLWIQGTTRSRVRTLRTVDPIDNTTTMLV